MGGGGGGTRRLVFFLGSFVYFLPLLIHRVFVQVVSSFLFAVYSKYARAEFVEDFET